MGKSGIRTQYYIQNSLQSVGKELFSTTFFSPSVGMAPPPPLAQAGRAEWEGWGNCRCPEGSISDCGTPPQPAPFLCAQTLPPPPGDGGFSPRPGPFRVSRSALPLGPTTPPAFNHVGLLRTPKKTNKEFTGKKQTLGSSAHWGGFVATSPTEIQSDNTQNQGEMGQARFLDIPSPPI